jgi:hypothetical protein
LPTETIAAIEVTVPLTLPTVDASRTAVVGQGKRRCGVARGGGADDRNAILEPSVGDGAAATVKVAVEPTLALWFAGWVVMVGAVLGP